VEFECGVAGYIPRWQHGLPPYFRFDISIKRVSKSFEIISSWMLQHAVFAVAVLNVRAGYARQLQLELEESRYKLTLTVRQLLAPKVQVPPGCAIPHQTCFGRSIAFNQQRL
jgi:hypothetical protein